jgi:phytoene dehydrogenase-like protein
MGPEALEAYNRSYPGGDITGGAVSLRQILLRPRATLDPYRIARDVWLCSSATPPGAGVHGMCGYHAARSVRRHLAGRA